MTAPVSVEKIVIGKFLALVTIFAVPIVIMCLYPLILSSFGTIAFKTAYTNILGLFLYGITFVAIGMFISSITESQVISAILSIVVLLLGYLMGSLTNIISSNGNILTKILGSFDLYTPAQNFFNGVINLSDVVYYLTLTALFIFLTIQSIEKRRWNISKKFIGRGIFSGSFIAIVVVITVFVNLLAGVVTSNEAWASVDMTSMSLYTLSDDTIKMVKNIDDDIDIYVMASKSSADDTLKKTLAKYETYSKHINVEYKDTKKYPNFYKEYTDSAPTSGSLIIYCESTKKSKVVDYNNIYVSDSYSYYTSGSSSASEYDGEGQIDSAIAYVRSKSTYKIYKITGHDEATSDTSKFGSSQQLSEVIEKYNCEVEEISLLNRKEITTTECSAVLLLGPEKDYTKDEASIIKKYLNNGGNAIVGIESLLSYTVDKPNFYSILKEFNIKVNNGIIAENDSSFYSPSYGPYYMFANGITGYAEGLSSYVFTPYAAGLSEIKNGKDNVTYTALATTSDSAVLKKDATNLTSTEKEKGDKSGPFDVVVSAQKTISDTSNKTSNTKNSEASTNSTTEDTDTSNSTEKTANMLVFGSVYALSDTVDQLVSNSNTQIVNNALNEYIDTEVTTVSVPAKSLSSESLTVTESGTRTFGILIAIVAPVIILAAGIIVWVRRRKY